MSRRSRTARPDLIPLRAAGLDRRFDRHQLEHLAAFTDVTRVPAGVVLAMAGATAHQFTAVLEGEVSVSRDGEEPVLAGAGAQFGAVELVADTPYPSTVTTAADSSLIVVIFGPAFRWAVGAAGATSGDLCAESIIPVSALGEHPTRWSDPAAGFHLA